MLTALTVLIAASSLLTIVGQYRSRMLVYVFKPLTTTLIVVLAMAAHGTTTPHYFHLILAGLVFSLAGDVFLMLPQDRFVPGLVSFLIAHLLYIVAFGSQTGYFSAPLLALPFAAAATLLLTVLLPKATGLKIPVLVYAAALAAMGWQATTRWHVMPNDATFYAMVGAILFMISDSILAINRFAKPFRAAQAALLSTYFAAQWLIALSV